jgi:hypothetical protein
MHLLFVNKLTVKILCVCSLHGCGKSYLSQFAADQASVPARGLSVMWSIFQRYQNSKKISELGVPSHHASKFILQKVYI